MEHIEETIPGHVLEILFVDVAAWYSIMNAFFFSKNKTGARSCDFLPFSSCSVSYPRGPLMLRSLVDED